jgi:Myb-like DNA-binding protein BAS1
VKKHGNDWVAVAAIVTGRSNHQCSQRWTHVLDPSIGKKAGKWKPEEDGKLAEAVKKHGNDWVAVAALVPGRTSDQCLKRWTNSLDPLNGKKGKWAPEEDATLIKAVKKHGNDWVAVAALVSGRTNHQCRRRSVFHLDPDRASNTAEEEHNDGNDEALVDGYIGNDEALV